MCADSACSRSKSANRCISSRLCTAVSCRTVSRRGSGADSGAGADSDDDAYDGEGDDDGNKLFAMAMVASEE